LLKKRENGRKEENGNNVDGTCHERDYLLKNERKQRLQLLWVSEFMKNFMK